MSLLITDDRELRSLLPNTFETVEGEASLFSKLEPSMRNSEQFLFNSICSLQDLTSQPEALEFARQYVVRDAMAASAPMLDVVLTPNGYGIVSTTNIAPASKERVERLIRSLESGADTALLNLFQTLRLDKTWREGVFGSFFAMSLIPDLGHTVSDLKDVALPSRMWPRYMQLRNLSLPAERYVADRYISPELMMRFRREVLEGAGGVMARNIVNIVMLEIEGQDIHRLLMSTVDEIRNNPELYPEWQQSRTRLLFEPPTFQNQKHSSGYFF